ncbi:transcriptional regulator, TetR family [Aeromicrobium marinum DSM 15272]|uniref:Transcriptional regulator, TetR family n=1 Tax=Aeromicrobium marinum DSM 15272 TaxID=585531 RepID=E2S836_9ACTN|nr:TetR/AcrR family transcriptional regulator [Aeromicrobium marinum]EFQ84852.1 transcriptional regulator, TetR family [Aeromicrobium marinum DSM 15272]
MSTANVVDGRTARWRGQRERRRTEIVDTAVEVISRVGPTASVADVVAACGITRPVLYRHFDGRDDLDRAIADRCSLMLLDHLQGRLSADGGIEAGLRRAVDTYLDFVLQHRHLYDFTRSADRGRPGAEVVDRIRAVVVAVVAAAAAELMEEPDELGVPLDDVFAVGLVGMADGVVSHWLSHPDRITRQRMTEGLVSLLTAAIESVVRPA